MCFEVQPLTPQVDPDNDNDIVEEEARAVNMDDIVPDTRKYLLPHVESFFIASQCLCSWMMIFRLFRR